MGRPGESKDRRTRESKGGSTQDELHIPVKVQEPACKGNNWRDYVEWIFEDVDLTACGRLASNQLVNTCAGA